MGSQTKIILIIAVMITLLTNDCVFLELNKTSSPLSSSSPTNTSNNDEINCYSEMFSLKFDEFKYLNMLYDNYTEYQDGFYFSYTIMPKVNNFSSPLSEVFDKCLKQIKLVASEKFTGTSLTFYKKLKYNTTEAFAHLFKFLFTNPYFKSYAFNATYKQNEPFTGHNFMSLLFNNDSSDVETIN